MCLKALGRYDKAFLAAFLATISVGSLWIACTAIFHLQLPAFAILFGGIISFAVTYFSGGRGFTYQFIATVFTAVGIITFDGVAMLIVNYDLETILTQTPSWWSDYFRDLLNWDPMSLLWLSLGIAGGFWIWHHG